jgi:hypothetical protein
MVLADVLDNLPATLCAFFIFGGWVITSVVSTLAKNWRMVHESEHLAVLKQTLVERGMSVEEIEQVVKASPQPVEEEQKTADANQSPTVRLASKLAEHEVPAEQLEEILGAFQQADPAAQQTLAEVIESMLDNGADAERLLAAVRALFRPTRRAEPAPKDSRFTGEAGAMRS